MASLVSKPFPKRWRRRTRTRAARPCTPSSRAGRGSRTRGGKGPWRRPSAPGARAATPRTSSTRRPGPTTATAPAPAPVAAAPSSSPTAAAAPAPASSSSLGPRAPPLRVISSAVAVAIFRRRSVHRALLRDCRVATRLVVKVSFYLASGYSLGYCCGGGPCRKRGGVGERNHLRGSVHELTTSCFPGSIVAAVVLFGDVRHTASQSYNTGTAADGNGVSPDLPS